MARGYQQTICVSDFSLLYSRYFFAEREVLYRMISVHHSKGQSETIFKLMSEGMF